MIHNGQLANGDGVLFNGRVYRVSVCDAGYQLFPRSMERACDLALRQPGLFLRIDPADCIKVRDLHYQPSIVKPAEPAPKPERMGSRIRPGALKDGDVVLFGQTLYTAAMISAGFALLPRKEALAAELMAKTPVVYVRIDPRRCRHVPYQRPACRQYWRRA